MTAVSPDPRTDPVPIEMDDVLGPADPRHSGLPRSVTAWVTTTDHKAIGVAYAVTALVFLLIGGVLAGLIRAELASPGQQIVDHCSWLPAAGEWWPNGVGR